MRVNLDRSIFRAAAAVALSAFILLISGAVRAAPPGETPFGVYDPHGDFIGDGDVQIEHLFLPWEDVYLPSLLDADQYAFARNREVLVTIEPWTWSRDARNTPEILISGISTGAYDGNMRAICEILADFKSPVTVRWAQEMDDDSGQFIWANWEPSTYINAYRRMIDVCRTAAPDALIMWSPLGRENMADYYPGDNYVDVVGLSVFGLQSWEEEFLGRAQSFEDIFAPRYEMAVQFGKPVVVAELGYSGDPNYVGQWNDEVRNNSEKFSDLAGVIYFDQIEVHPWPNGYGLPDWRFAASGFVGGAANDAEATTGAPAPSGRPEYLVVGEEGAITQAAAALQDAGAAILRRQSLAALGVQILLTDLNNLLSLNEVRKLFAQANIPVIVDLNSNYDLAAPKDYAHRLIGFEPGASCPLQRPVDVGLIDGPIDLANPALNNVSITTNSVLGELAQPGSTDHATAIVSLIAATGDYGVVRGIAPGSQIFSVVAFESSSGRDFARLENVAKGLDWLVGREVPVVNLSLEGPFNRSLERIIELVASHGAVLVAAVGNAGEANVAYPAADPNVIAITAIDAAKRPYRRASFGPEVEFAAPGVDMVAAQKGGTAVVSGTSYAAAIATSLIAQEAQFEAITTPGVRDVFRLRSEDLGVAGRDPIFGWGLIKISGC